MAAITTIILISLTLLLNPGISGEAPGSLTLHKCCQRGEILSLHTKECIAERDWQKGIENISLPVLSFSNQSQPDYRVTFDFVPLDRCPTKQKVNIYFDIYGHRGQFKFLDTQTVQLFDQDTVCFDRAFDPRTNSESFLAQKCLECEGPCLNFCCPEGFTNINNTCIESLTENSTESRADIITSDWNFTYVSAKLHCTDTEEYYDSSKLRIKEDEDNMVEIDGVLYETSEYCLDQFEDRVLLCQKDSQDESQRRVMKLVVMSVSIVALIIVIMLHLLIEELRHNHITKLKIPLYLSILLSFLVVVISSGWDFLGSLPCIFIGFLLQFSALSVFFWLTAISVDVWLTFKSFSPANQVSRIKECFLFSILSPLAVTMTTIFLQFYQSQDTDSYVHPRIGSISCSLARYLPQFLYFHLIIIVLLVTNLIMFCCFLVQFTCGAWQDCVSRVSNYNIAAELFFLMGINWITESTSFMVGWYDKPKSNHPVFLVLDFINWSIGIILLVLFLCKPSNRKHLNTLLEDSGWSSASESLTVKTMTSQVSNLSSDSKLSIRFRNNIIFGSQNKQIV